MAESACASISATGEARLKYDDLRAIASHAESCHAKPQFDANGTIERDDYAHCLQITGDADFQGPYTLIYDGPDPNEQASLAAEKAIVEQHCARCS